MIGGIAEGKSFSRPAHSAMARILEGLPGHLKAGPVCPNLSKLIKVEHLGRGQYIVALAVFSSSLALRADRAHLSSQNKRPGQIHIHKKTYV